MYKRSDFAWIWALCVAVTGVSTGLVNADDVAAGTSVLPSVAVRFAAAAETTDVAAAAIGRSGVETPDFQRHVVPLLGKLGCNGRACHGSFQGRGDFRLSLFGYDFKADHDELQGRLDPLTPQESLILQKPLMQIPHEGGRRLHEGGWEHHLLLSWIQHEAPAVAKDAATLVELRVTPSEIQFQTDDQQQQLTAVAVWSDGSLEDVTTLCRFQTNDDQVAEITQEGVVSAGSPGDTHVVVFYDKAVIPIPILRPVSDKFGDQYPDVPAPTKVDQLVVQKLQKLGIVQAELCSDEEFLRRASLDTTATLPTPSEIRAFMQDTRSDKRSRKIDELLERPGYVAWWTTRLCDYTGNSDDQLNNVTPVQNQASKQWYDWIFSRVQANVGYDDLVEGLVMAVSREPGESYEQYCENQSRLYHRNSDATLADRTSMPHYWSRQNFRTSEDRVIGFAYTFLGTRIQCAQCHKHPFDRWTQQDFQAFEGFFKGTQGQINNPRPDSRKQYAEMLSKLDGAEGLKGNELRRHFAQLLAKGEVVPFGEVYAVPPAPAQPRRNAANRNANRNNRGPVPASARLLGGADLDLTEYEDIRTPLMAWLRAPDNPLFAKAFVNRVWSNYFHRGIVHPSDDLNLANPPSNAALLDYLAQGFIENDFDMKWLHRAILNSRTYQLSWVPNETNRLDEKNFSRAVPRRIPAEVAWDMMAQAVTSTAGNQSMVNSLEKRAISIPGSGIRVRNRTEADYALTVFGRSVRESNCDCDRSEEPSLLQTIFVRNDGQLLSMIDNSSSWLAEVASSNGISLKSSQPNQNGPGPGGGRRMNQAAQANGIEKRITLLTTQLKRAEKRKEDVVAEKLRTQIARLKKQAERNSSEAAEATATEKPSQNSAEGGGQDTNAADSTVEVAVAEKLPKGWDSAALISEAYLRTVSRMPNASELQTAEQYILEAEDPVQGLRSVLWALVNTKEFIVNH